VPLLKRRRCHAYSPAHFAIAASVSSFRQCLRSRFFGLSGLSMAGVLLDLVVLEDFMGGWGARMGAATGPAAAGSSAFDAAADIAVTGGTGAGTGAGCGAATAATGLVAGGWTTGAAESVGATGFATAGSCFKPKRLRSRGSRYTNAPAATMTSIPMSNNIFLSTIFLSQAKSIVESASASSAPAILPAHDKLQCLCWQ
jgi:hypothetical protein